jgi:hypothetical protein
MGELLVHLFQYQESLKKVKNEINVIEPLMYYLRNICGLQSSLRNSFDYLNSSCLDLLRLISLDEKTIGQLIE